MPLIAETTTATGAAPGGLGRDPGDAGETRAVADRSASELDHEGSIAHSLTLHLVLDPVQPKRPPQSARCPWPLTIFSVVLVIAFLLIVEERPDGRS
jgi:hypothetical protein